VKVVVEDKHVFAIYFNSLSKCNLVKSQNFTICDKSIIHRIKKVLRLSEGEELVLFDDKQKVKLKLLKEDKSKKNILNTKVLSVSQNIKPKNEIILSVGLLKKENFERIVYFAAAMGANVIQPFISHKIQRKWGGAKEVERLQKILISACEQSKNFNIPQILEPLSFDKFIKNLNTNSKKICFEVDGASLFDLLSDLNEFSHNQIILTFGPEGGFSSDEIAKLRKVGFGFVKLTPTILRSVEAVAVGLGSVRSIVVN
jgi:16S rRNA (uracil1498-N3)-methyltransferase